MSSQIDVAAITRRGAEALQPHRLVRFNASGQWVYADAGETPIGCTSYLAAPGDLVGCWLLANKAGTLKIEAAGAISEGNEVYSAADGRVSEANTGVRVGIALETVSGSGSIIEILQQVRRVPYVDVSAPTAGASSTAEATLSTFTVPASELRVGSVIRAIIAGRVTGLDSTPQVDVKLYVGTELIGTATVSAAALNDECLVIADFVVTAIGTGGKILGVVARGFDAVGIALGADVKQEASESLAAGAVVKSTVKFATSHASNQFTQDLFLVQVLS